MYIYMCVCLRGNAEMLKVKTKYKHNLPKEMGKKYEEESSLRQ